MRIRKETIENFATMHELESEFTVAEFAKRIESPLEAARNLVMRYKRNGYLTAIAGTVTQTLPSSVKPEVIYERTVKTTYFSLTSSALSVLREKGNGVVAHRPVQRPIANSVFNLGLAMSMPTQRDFLAALGPCGK